MMDSTMPPPQPPTAPPPPPASQGPPPPYGPPPAQRVSGPAIGLIVTAVVGGILAVFSLVWHLAFGTAAGLGNLGGEYDRFSGLFSGTIGVVSAAIGLVLAAFIVYAALEMRKLQSWTLVMIASILAMIPCISPCCIIGIPIGIWSLVVLTKPEVKAAFR